MDAGRDGHRRSRPSAEGLARLAAALDANGPPRVLRRLGGGIASATHALDVPGVGAVVLKRYPAGDTTPAQEAAALAYANNAGLPAPRLVSVDVDGAWFGTPALAMLRVAGRADVAPTDAGRYVREVATVAARVHGVELGRVPTALRRPHHVDTWRTPEVVPPGHLAAGVARRVVEAITEHLPSADRGPATLNHADFHPGNLVWWRGRLAAVVDWSAAKVGFRWWDIAYFRNELAVLVDVDAADDLLDAYETLVGARSTHQPLWDLMCVYSAHRWMHEWLRGYREQGRRDLTIDTVRPRLRALARRTLGRIGG